MIKHYDQNQPRAGKDLFDFQVMVTIERSQGRELKQELEAETMKECCL